jgi:hypothetical protein
MQVAAAAAIAGALLCPRPALAQGCICARQGLPQFGGTRSPYLHRGEWQLGASYRFQDSDRFYSGIRPATGVPRAERTQHIFDVSGTYGLDEQTALTLTVPLADLSFGLGLPVPGGPINDTHTSGIGDLTLAARRWLLKCPTHPDQNVAIGVGLKFPTGRTEARDRYGTPGGGPRTVKPVDISTQPGDGGFGIILDINAFRKWKDTTFYASGLYLINPRETNGTPSLAVGLMGLGATPKGIRENTVPDQYVARVGVAHALKHVPGLALSLGARIEGVPPSDLFGGSKGFRFAGYVLFIEPGITYTRGDHTFALSVPVRLHQNVQDVAASPGPDIATIVDQVVLFSYTRRFGR